MNAELASFNWRETQLSYDGVALDICNDRKSNDVAQFGRYFPDGIIDPPLEKVGDWYTDGSSSAMGRAPLMSTARRSTIGASPRTPTPGWRSRRGPGTAAARARWQ
jgi:hypothetical protein